MIDEDMREIMVKAGYREDYNPMTRFNLKTEMLGYVISTVDLGLDHSFGEGQPLYYETMIFKNGNYYNNSKAELMNMQDTNLFENYQERYSTQERAVKGHLEAVKIVRERILGNDKA